MRAIILAGIVFSASVPLDAQELAPEVESAMEALEMGIPEVATARLQGWLQSNPEAPDAPEVREHLVEALLLSSDLEEARAEVARLPEDSARSAWLLGQIAASEGNWQEAAGHFQVAAKAPEGNEQHRAARVAQAYSLVQARSPMEAVKLLEILALEDAGPLGNRESLLLADTLITLDKLDEAAAILDGLKVEEGPDFASWRWIQARSAWQRGEVARVIELTEVLMEPGIGITPGLLGSAHLLRARALAKSGDHMAAAAVLEKYLNRYPESPQLAQVFVELNRVYVEAGNTDFEELDRWSQARSFELRRHAVYYAGLQRMRVGRTGDAIAVLSSWLQLRKDEPLGEMGRVALAEAFLKYGDPTSADAQLAAVDLKILPSSELPKFTYLRGATAFTLERYEEAVERFNTLRGMDLPEEGIMIALYNLAQSYTAVGDYESFLEAYKDFSIAYPESPLRRELVLEEGLFQARHGDARAVQTLGLFVRDFAGHPRLPEAQLGLAELAYGAELPDLEGAMMWLAEIDRETATPEVLVAADYLEIFIAESRGADAVGLEARVMDFLAANEGSVHTAELLTKVGEKHFEEQNYLAAQGMFERAAAATTGAAAGKAYFLAGLAAVRTLNPVALDQALGFFESVVRLDGNLRMEARLEQARVKMRQGQFSDAVLLCQNALAATPREPLRYELMMAVGEAEAAAVGTDATAAERSIAAFHALAEAENVPPLWRNQALWKAAQILERTGDSQGALLAYYDAFAEDPTTAPEPDFFWFYKAAFDAARLLESDGKVESAVGVYRRLSILPGPRAAEATQRLNRLRLEHFLWEE